MQHLELTGITATNGVDFNLTAGTLTFNPGETTKTISATIVDDSLNEADETFSMTLSNPSNVTLGTNVTHNYTILDNDPLPLVEFASTTSATPDESATNRTVQIILSAVSGQNVSVTVSRTGGSSNIHDLTASPNAMGCPNFGNFIGQEKLKTVPQKYFIFPLR